MNLSDGANRARSSRVESSSQICDTATIVDPVCLWFTGLSGSGKTTIADIVKVQLAASGVPSVILDGDELRQGLNSDLGFSLNDRVENIRRVAEVAHLLVQKGLVVIVALISPLEAERQRARRRFAKDQFLEIFVDTPLDTCESRDVKGLYARARRGEIAEFTGISSPYEPPVRPDLRIKTPGQIPQQCARVICDYLFGRTGG